LGVSSIDEAGRGTVPISAPPPGWTDPHPAGSRPEAGDLAPAHRSRPRRPLLWLGATTIAAIAAVLLLSLRGGPPGTPFAPIADAAERTAKSPGARLAGTGSITMDGHQLSMQFSGEYDGRADRSLMRMQMNAPEAPQVAAMMNPFIAIQDGLVSYFSTPAFNGRLPGGKSWMKIDASDFAGAPEQGSATDAGALLDQLRAVGAEAQELGTEPVRGAPTTHYQAVIEADGGDTTVGVWVDRNQRIRRLLTNAPFNLPGEAPAMMAIQLEFYDFGIEPAIDPPPASATLDATELARQGAEQALDAS